MFSVADVMLLSKIDLMPHLRFNLDLAINNAISINPALKIFPVSSYTGEGLEAWYSWLRTQFKNADVKNTALLNSAVANAV